MIIQVIIVVCSVLLFVISFLLNRRTKLPENMDLELPEKCLGCSSEMCKIKNNDLKDQSIVDTIISKCEEIDE